MCNTRSVCWEHKEFWVIVLGDPFNLFNPSAVTVLCCIPRQFSERNLRFWGRITWHQRDGARTDVEWLKSWSRSIEKEERFDCVLREIPPHLNTLTFTDTIGNKNVWKKHKREVWHGNCFGKEKRDIVTPTAVPGVLLQHNQQNRIE